MGHRCSSWEWIKSPRGTYLVSRRRQKPKVRRESLGEHQHLKMGRGKKARRGDRFATQLKRDRVFCTLLLFSTSFRLVKKKKKRRSRGSQEATWDGNVRMSQGPTQSFSGCKPPLQTQQVSGEMLPHCMPGHEGDAQLSVMANCVGRKPVSLTNFATHTLLLPRQRCKGNPNKFREIQTSQFSQCQKRQRSGRRQSQKDTHQNLQNTGTVRTETKTQENSKEVCFLNCPTSPSTLYLSQIQRRYSFMNTVLWGT